MIKNINNLSNGTLKIIACTLVLITCPYYLIILSHLFAGFALHNDVDPFLSSSFGLAGVGIGVVYSYMNIKIILDHNSTKNVMVRELFFLIFLFIIFIFTGKEPSSEIVNFLESLI